LVRWSLVGTLVLAPLLLSGCGADKAATTAEPTKGPAWVVVSAGRATGSPAPAAGRAAVPSTFPTGFLPLPSATPTPAPSSSSCDPTYPRSLRINGATVETSTTTGTVTWWNRGGSDLVEYRVTAIAQDLEVGEQRDVGWTVVTPSEDCGYQTAMVTGLEPQSSYVFSVDAVTTGTARDRDGTYARTVARSLPVMTK
jgi:hypothetical protein